MTDLIAYFLLNACQSEKPIQNTIPNSQKPQNLATAGKNDTYRLVSIHHVRLDYLGSPECVE